MRLVVYAGPARAPSVFFNEKRLCGLGADLTRTGRLAPDGRRRALAAIRRFRALASEMDADPLRAVATAALRDAADGPEFRAELETALGAPIMVASGAEEARLAAQGVLFGAPAAEGVVADMGGASMELAALRPGDPRDVSPDARIGARATTPLGPLRLLGRPDFERARAIEEAVGGALAAPGGDAFADAGALYALGGSWRATARAFMAREEYPLRVLHGFELPLEAAIEAADWVGGLTPEELRGRAGVSERRAAVTPAAAEVLAGVLRALRPERLVVSAFGLREGVLWDIMSPEMRAQDPLLVAAEDIESALGRAAGFGEATFRLLAPVFGWETGAPSPPPEPENGFWGGAATEARLAGAAFRLVDARWRTHPDYRAQASFELVTRGNLGGATHFERVFIGLALLHRHKGGGRAARSEPSIALLPDAARRRAKAIGRGARLAAALSAGLPEPLAGFRFSRDGDAVILRAAKGSERFLGEDAEKQLGSFAAALRLNPRIETDATG